MRDLTYWETGVKKRTAIIGVIAGLFAICLGVGAYLALESLLHPASPPAPDLIDAEVVVILEALGLPADLDPQALAVLEQRDPHGSWITARIRLQPGQADAVETALPAPEVAGADFSGYQLGGLDAYDVPWWDPLPLAPGDRLHEATLDEPGGTQLLLVVMRPRAEALDLYILRTAARGKLAPGFHSVMEVSPKRYAGDWFPSNNNPYERAQGRFLP